MNAVRNDFLTGKYDEILNQLYGAENLEQQKSRYIKAIDEFLAIYKNEEIRIFSASGRSEICGNHTDHQNGKVLAAAVNLDAIAIAAKRDDNTIRITSEGYGEITVDSSITAVVPEEMGTTVSLIRGTVSAIKARGYDVSGFDAYVTSDVLSGSGLSSSAAFEVLIANIVAGLYDADIDAVEIAKIGKEAENKYFGKPSGLLDQMTSSVGGLINIDFYGGQQPKIKKLDVDFGQFGHSLCIVDTKGSHANLTDEYAAITEEMRAVSEFFGKDVLSEIAEEEFFEKIAEVREKAGDRAVLRAIHFFEENKRVDKQVAALTEGDFDKFKSLIKSSGDSSFRFLQNVYSQKDTKNQGVSLGVAASEVILKDAGVCRVHGGGFAGTIQAFVPRDKVAEYKEKIEKVFGKDSCYVLNIRPFGGIEITK